MCFVTGLINGTTSYKCVARDRRYNLNPKIQNFDPVEKRNPSRVMIPGDNDAVIFWGSLYESRISFHEC